MEASSGSPITSGARAAVTNDIFSDTKIRNASFPSRRQESCLPRPGGHREDIFSLTGSLGI